MKKEIDQKNHIASNLKYLRNLYGKSLSEVANVCGKTDVAVHYWETGSREPSAVDIAKLSNYYNVTIDDLILKDLRFFKKEYNEIIMLLHECQDILTKDDEDYIKFIIEKRKKESEEEKKE